MNESMNEMNARMNQSINRIKKKTQEKKRAESSSVPVASQGGDGFGPGGWVLKWLAYL